MLKIRRPLGRLIFNMGIAIPGKTVFLIETAPRVTGVVDQSHRLTNCILFSWGSWRVNGKKLMLTSRRSVWRWVWRKIVNSTRKMTADPSPRTHTMTMCEWALLTVEFGHFNSLRLRQNGIPQAAYSNAFSWLKIYELWFRVPTRSLFPGKVLAFNNGSLGPGKVLSFSSFPKRS